MCVSKNILIIFKYNNHVDLINRLVEEMSKKGLKISGVNSVYYNWLGAPFSKMWLIKSFQFITKIPKVRGLFLKLFKRKILETISKEYHIVDFHSFNSDDIIILKYLKLMNKQCIITFWGSDILCASSEDLGKLLINSKNVSLFRAVTPEIFHKLDTMKLKSKVSLCSFGVHGIDLINDLINKKLHIDVLSLPVKLKMALLDEPVVVVIGNNGNKRQNHLKVIDSIRKHQNNLDRFNLLFVIALGYSVSAEYKKQINFKLSETNLKYIVIDEYFSNKEFGILTCITDVYITMQDSDAFSFYLQEHLASGTIVLYGNWLPYKRLEAEGVFACGVNFDDIGDILIWVLKSMKNLKEKTENNKKIMSNISSWDYRKDEWFNSYQSVAN